MSFAELLYELPTEQLKRIVERRSRTLRGIPRITNKRELVRFLASALSNRDSISRALESTTLAEIRTLIAMVARGGDVSFDELIASVGEENRQRLEDAIESLESLGLAIRRRRAVTWGVFVPNAVREGAPLPVPLRHRLKDWLPKQAGAAVKKVVEQLGLEGPDESAAAIAHYLSAPGRARNILDSLSDNAREVMDILLAAGGVISLQELSTHLDGRKRNRIMTAGWVNHWYVGKPQHGVEELLCHGLAIVQSSGGWGGWQIIVPGEVLEALLGRSLTGEMLPPVPAAEGATAGAASAHFHSTLIRDAVSLMGSVGRIEAPRTSSGNIHKNSLKSLSRGLTIPTPKYAAFVYSVVRDAGLIAPLGRKELYDITQRGEQWLDEPKETQVKALYQAWRSHASWGEVFADPFWDGKTYRSVTDLDELREPIVTLISEFARDRPDDFISLQSLADIAWYRWWARFQFDIRRRSMNPEGTDCPNFYGFVDSNLDLIRNIALESLYWLGLTESTGNDGSDYVRLTHLGRSLLLNEKTSSAADRSEESRFIVQPNMEVYAPPDLPGRELYRLFGISEPTASGMLSITRDSLRRALDRGEQSVELITFLRDRSRSGLPQNVEYLIKEVGGRHGHIRIGQAGLFIQVDDPMLLKELQAQKGLKIKFREQLADTVALISGDSLDAVLRQLRQAGYLPVTTEAAAAVKAPREAMASVEEFEQHKSARQDVDGRIDWSAVAATGDESWSETPTQQPARLANSARNKSAVREMMLQAIREQRCVEISYRKTGESKATVRVVEPDEINGHLLRAFCRLRQDERMFALANIVEAHFTGEVFEIDD